METALAIVGWIAFGLAIGIGLVLDLFGLFGNWIILLALGALWVLTDFIHFGYWAAAGFVALAALGEILEMLCAAFGAKRYGGSRGGMAAALVGCLLGAAAGSPLFPVLGTLLGAFAGAFAGAAIYEHLENERTPREAVRVGVGAAIGKMGGLIAKLACGIAMLLLAVLTY